MRVLIVEDDAAIRHSLATCFSNQGWVVDQAQDGREGSYYFDEYAYAVAIVDLGLPVIDGISLIEQVRAKGNHTPILILTARDHWQEKVLGLDAGADDYLAKPFQTEELLARLHALIRRAAGQGSARIIFGPLALDLKEHRVWMNNQPVVLTDFEYRLLACFVQKPMQVISKSHLMDQLYGADSEADSNTIEVFIRRLRKKIDPDAVVKPIETVRGQGYRFNPDTFNSH